MGAPPRYSRESIREVLSSMLGGEPERQKSGEEEPA
jgi:hypothetical protein